MAALTNNPITLYGDGSQTRSFCYIDDLIDGLLAMMESDVEITGPINLGNPGEFTVKELAEKIIEKIPTTSTMEFLPLPQDDPVRRQPDITRAKTQLGWEPTIALDQGLDKTIDYFKGVIKQS
jgi:UDP-glucuronate decarboxylase